MVGFKVGIQMTLLEMARRIQKSCEMRTATLVHWRGASFHNITADIQGSYNCGQVKDKSVEGAEK